MKNNYDKQRKYSLRKSKVYGLTLAVIGVLYFGNSTVNVSADVVTNSNNTTTISNSLASVTVDTDKYLENNEKTADQLYTEGAYTTPETKTTGTEVVSETKTTDYNYVSTTDETIAPTVTTDKSQDITKDYTVGGKSGKEYTNETADIPVDTTANKPETITSGDKTYRYKSTEVVSEGTSATTTATNFNDISVKTDTQGYHNTDGSVNYDNLSTGNTYLVEENADGTYGKFIKIDSPSGLTDAKVKELAAQSSGTFNSASVTLNDNDNVIVYEKNTYAARKKDDVDLNTLAYQWGFSHHGPDNNVPTIYKIITDFAGKYPELTTQDGKYYYKGILVGNVTDKASTVGNEPVFGDASTEERDNAPIYMNGTVAMELISDMLLDNTLNSDEIDKRFDTASDKGEIFTLVENVILNRQSEHYNELVKSGGLDTANDIAKDGKPTFSRKVTSIDKTYANLDAQISAESAQSRGVLEKRREQFVKDILHTYSKANYEYVLSILKIGGKYRYDDPLTDDVIQKYEADKSLDNYNSMITDLDKINFFTLGGGIEHYDASTLPTEASLAKETDYSAIKQSGDSIQLRSNYVNLGDVLYNPKKAYHESDDIFTYHDEITPLRAYKVGAKNAVVKYVYEEVKKAPVIANYYKDGTTDKLADSDDQGQKEVDSNYTTTAKAIEPKVETIETESKTITRTTNYVLKETPSNANGTVPEQGEVVNYYYVENVTETVTPKQAPVIANYYKDGTADKLADSDDQGQKDIDSNYTTTAKTIEPKVETIDSPEKTVTRTTTYELKEMPSNANGTVPVGGAVVNYYYVENVTETVTPKQAPVIANYYKDGTTEKLSDSDDQGQKDISSKYSTTAKTIEPKVETIETDSKTVTRTTTYTLKEVPSNSEGTVPVGGAVVDYYYVENVTETVVPKQAPVIANYYKDGTTDKLADSDDQGQKDIDSKYSTVAKTIEPKVEVVESPEKTVTRTTAYELKEVPSNSEGNVPVDGAVVNYYYVEKVTETVTPKQAPVIANYYKDGTTEKLADSDNQGDKNISSDYSTVAKTIEPKVETVDTPEKTITRTTTYELVEVPSNATGKVPVGGATVNYYYVEKVKEDVVNKQAPVIANYYKDGTNEKLADSDDQGKKDISSDYTTIAKTIEPKVETIETDSKTITRTTTYTLKETPSNANGKVPVNGSVVDYYYVENVTETAVNKQAPVVANYYKDGTTDKLADSDDQGQKDIDSKYSTSAKTIEPKVETIESSEKTVTRTTTYELKEVPSNSEGNVPVGGAVVNYYYVEKVTETVVNKQAPVIANYYKDGTTDKLADSDDQGMKDINSNYTTTAKTIEPKVETFEKDGETITRTTTYELKEVPSNANGNVPVEGAAVNYYYVEKVTETKVPKPKDPETPKPTTPETPKREEHKNDVTPVSTSKQSQVLSRVEDRHNLPETGESKSGTATAIGLLTLGAGLLGFKKRKNDEN